MVGEFLNFFYFGLFKGSASSPARARGALFWVVACVCVFVCQCGFMVSSHDSDAWCLHVLILQWSYLSFCLFYSGSLWVQAVSWTQWLTNSCLPIHPRIHQPHLLNSRLNLNQSRAMRNRRAPSRRLHPTYRHKKGIILFSPSQNRKMNRVGVWTSVSVPHLVMVSRKILWVKVCGGVWTNLMSHAGAWSFQFIMKKNVILHSFVSWSRALVQTQMNQKNYRACRLPLLPHQTLILAYENQVTSIIPIRLLLSTRFLLVCVCSANVLVCVCSANDVDPVLSQPLVCRLATTNHSNYQKSGSTHGIQLARSHFP